MAVRFDNVADNLNRTTGILDYNSVYTWMFWLYLGSDLNTVVTFAALSDGGAANVDELRTATDGTTLRLRVAIGGAGTNADTTITLATWTHIALVRESATSLKLYKNGVLATTNTRDITGRATASRMQFGGAGNTDSRVSTSKVWPAVLTQAEIENERWSILPKRASQYAVWPLFPGSGERTRDYSGNGRDWTEGGTLTDEAGPPVPWGMFSSYIAFTPVEVVAGAPVVSDGGYSPIFGGMIVR